MGHQPYPPTQDIIPGGWVKQEGGGYPTGLPPKVDIATLGVSNATMHSFTADLQGAVVAGVGAVLTSPSIAVMKFVCGVEGYGDFPPIWEKFARG